MPETSRRIVCVLGGNAFLPSRGRLTMAGQFAFARQALEHLGPLFAPDVQLLVSHGNGPQVGHMLLRVEAAKGRAYELPLDVCVATSAGELGYVLQQTLQGILAERGVDRAVAALLTQVVVAAGDPAFRNPTKPVGPAYDGDRAAELSAQGCVLKVDGRRGWRRVVPSPEPVEVVELETLRALLEAGHIVIAAGGGGIPVLRENGRLRGVEAVIDKDLVAALIGERLGAERLIILTDVACAYRDFGTADARPIRRATPAEAGELAAAGHFASGSMEPKMRACARFAERTGGAATICNPEGLADALAGRGGTTVAVER